MAQNISRLLNYQSIAENDKINIYALNTASGEAGTFVTVQAANLGDDPISYVSRPDAFANTLGNATSNYPESNFKVRAAVATDTGTVVGMLLNDVREIDENGQSLHFYPEKKAELQCVVSGEVCPIATRGTVEVNSRAFSNGVAPAINDLAVLVADGRLTGVAITAATAAQKAASVGHFMGTGIRVSQQSTDEVAGPYALLKFSL